MKYKRLASCLYQGIYPFDKFKIFQGLETVVVRTPEDLKPNDVLIVWGGEDIALLYMGKKQEIILMPRIFPVAGILGSGL
jgi:glutamine amidotransferase PdxT